MERGALFSFRQRAGKLEWKEISSIEIEEVVKNIKVNQLQQLLDLVTFSEVNLQDIKVNNVDNILKLIQIMQLIVEYLLFHQENQFQTINKNNSKISTLRRDRGALEQENISLREDIKTYKRQLHILRKALQGGGNALTDNSKNGPRIIYPVEQQNNSNQANNNASNLETKEIIKTLVDHEHDARRMMSSLLEEQRHAFHHEMTLLIDSLRQMQNNNNNSNNTSTNNNNSGNMVESYHLLMENMKLQFQQLIQTSLEQTKENNQRIGNQNNTSTVRQSMSNETGGILKSFAMQSLQEELLKKEKQLFEKEEFLQRREQILNQESRNHETNQKRYYQRLLSLKTLFGVLNVGKLPLFLLF
jgi:hypothetical protein